ncbi:RdRP-domain-containing protein [Lichtheimia hyalospora FSU 10163]|nr:RdRP-domain-containing protein [Lichtheimia hyalospora FSU 10163]
MAMLRQNSDEDGISREMAAMVQHGFLASGDPYIAHLLHVYRLCKLKEAKKRAKIPVVKGAHLLGIMDETGTLKQDEVFCQLSDSSHTEACHVVKGECLVFRSPALHPGDARILKAVERSELKHLYNVVVFSSKGSRDVPSMLSGGDLDGDTYSIIWDKRLYPPNDMRNKEPMDVTPPEPKKVDQVQIGDIHDFFVEYIENDNLGLIANAHLARADMSDVGVFDVFCMELAQLHSHAVDFPKTGVKAILPDSYRPGKYPDFMEKKDKPSYESKKILGQLYRSIKSGEFQHYRKQLNTKKTEYDGRLRYPGMEKFIARARRMKRRYDEELTSLMDQFGIPTEAEFMTGCIIRTYRHDEHKSYFELRSMARREMMKLKEYWRSSEFVTLRKRSRNPPTREQVEEDCAKAAAFYYVTYHRDEQEKTQLYYGAYRKNRNLLLSFAWLAQELLFKVLKQHQYGIIAPFQDPIAPVEEEYESFEEYLEPEFSDEEPVSDDGCF